MAVNRKGHVTRAEEATPEAILKQLYPEISTAYPLLHCRRTKTSGEVIEVVIGPCILKMLKWVVIGLFGYLVALRGASVPALAAFIGMLCRL